MYNFRTKKKYTSPEITIRNYLVDFLLNKYEFEINRKAINVKGLTVFVDTPPLIKKRLLFDQKMIIGDLVSQGIEIARIR